MFARALAVCSLAVLPIAACGEEGLSEDEVREAWTAVEVALGHVEVAIHEAAFAGGSQLDSFWQCPSGAIEYIGRASAESVDVNVAFNGCLINGIAIDGMLRYYGADEFVISGDLYYNGDVIGDCRVDMRLAFADGREYSGSFCEVSAAILGGA